MATDISLQAEMAAYEAQREELERDHLGKWVVFHDAHLVDIYDDLQAAANEAVRRYGRGPYLIQQIGQGPVTVPSYALEGLL